MEIALFLLMLIGGIAYGIARLIKRRSRNSPKNRLILARMALDKHLERVTMLEKTVEAFASIKSIDELLAFVNSIDCKNYDELKEKLNFTHYVRDTDDGLGPKLRYYLRNHEGLKNGWEAADSEEVWNSDWSMRVGVERSFWQRLRRELRIRSRDLQVAIEKLEAQVKVQEVPSQAKSVSIPDDKRAQLQRVRVDIAKMRLQEQKLEEEILDEQGNPVPNRRASGVSTND